MLNLRTQDPARKASVLEACAGHIAGMTKAEFQVTTIEKVFCLLFMQVEDIMTEEEKTRERIERTKRQLDEQKRRMKEEQEMGLDNQSVSSQGSADPDAGKSCFLPQTHRDSPAAVDSCLEGHAEPEGRGKPSCSPGHWPAAGLSCRARFCLTIADWMMDCLGSACLPFRNNRHC